MVTGKLHVNTLVDGDGDGIGDGVGMCKQALRNSYVEIM